MRSSSRDQPARSAGSVSRSGVELLASRVRNVLRSRRRSALAQTPVISAPRSPNLPNVDGRRRRSAPLMGSPRGFVRVAVLVAVASTALIGGAGKAHAGYAVQPADGSVIAT